MASSWNRGHMIASMKALPKRKGNVVLRGGAKYRLGASMKALPKRKGNQLHVGTQCRR